MAGSACCSLRVGASPCSGTGRGICGSARKLSGTRLFRDYRAAFREATGLPLEIRTLRSCGGAMGGVEGSNRFCALAASTQAGCRMCLQAQSALRQVDGSGSQTVECFSGMSDTVVPIRRSRSGPPIAFLQTGQVFLSAPDKDRFSAVARTLVDQGVRVDLQDLEDSYFSTKVFCPTRYRALVRLLCIFADQLALLADETGLDPGRREPELVSRARRYIKDRFRERIPLDQVARAVGASTRQFCKVFKGTTGMTFTDYLSRVRVSHAKQLLGNAHMCVSEIAFETGFESISQFNRAFRRITGISPTGYRQASVSSSPVGEQLPES